MLDNGKSTCSCTNINCPRHGNCGPCKAHHADKQYDTFCRRKKSDK